MKHIYYNMYFIVVGIIIIMSGPLTSIYLQINYRIQCLNNLILMSLKLNKEKS